MKIFITGASGFIGSHVAKLLIERGHTLVALVRDLNKLPALALEPQIEILHAQLSDHDKITTAMKSCEACVHIALGWGESPKSMADNDLTHTLFLLETALRFNYKHFLTTSSTAAMGELRLDMDESFDNRPIDFYGASKAAAESFVLAAGRKSFMQCNIIRPGYAFGQEAFPGGPSQPDHRFEDIVKYAMSDTDIKVINHDGTQFIEAHDLAQIYGEVLDSDWNREIFLGLGSKFTTWEEIAQIAIDLTHSKSAIFIQDKGWSETPCLFNVEKIKTHMNFDFDGSDEIPNHLKFLISKYSN